MPSKVLDEAPSESDVSIPTVSDVPIKVPSKQPCDVPSEGPANDFPLLLLPKLEFDESTGSLIALGLLVMLNSISSLLITSYGWIRLHRALKDVSTVDETVLKI